MYGLTLVCVKDSMAANISHFSTLFKQFSASLLSPKRATLVVLVLLGILGAWGWIHVTEKEQYLVQRNFRLLHLWSEDIRQKIESYQQVFKFAADGFKKIQNRNGASSPDLERRDSYNREVWLRPATKNAQTASPSSKKEVEKFSEVTWPCHSIINEPNLKAFEQSVKNVDDFSRQLRGLCETEGLTQIQVGQETTDKPKPSLEIISRQNPPKITLTHFNPPIRIVGEINLESFLDRLRNDAIFDEVLLFESPGAPNTTDTFPMVQTLIHHAGIQEFTWPNFKDLTQQKSPGSFWDTLFSPQQEPQVLPEKEGSHKSGSHRFSISVPGHSYEVFTKAVWIPGIERQEWILVGLVDEEKFHNSALAISSTTLLGVMFLLLILILALPLFHLKMMGTTDPLRSSHVLALVLSALLGTGLATFLGLDLAVYWEGQQQLQHQMEQSAQDIKEKFVHELSSILFTLQEFDRSPSLKSDFALLNGEAAGEQPPGKRSVLLEEQVKNPCLPGRVDITKGGGVPCYSDFLYAFWMDQDGSLRINWTKKEFEGKPVQGVTKNVSLKERPYVQAILSPSPGLWLLPQSESSEITSQKDYQSFFLQPIISWTTGLYTVVASMPSSPGQSKPPGWVAAMEFKFASLMDPIILSPGVGFAVIDESDHRVLFHSERGRNLREQFLVETDNNTTLRELLSAKTAGHAEGSYWGNSTSFYLLPLETVPWSLVVYRDKELLRSVNLMGLLIAGSFYGLWSLILYGAFWMFLKRPGSHRKAPWLWPTPHHTDAYFMLFIFNIVAFVVGFILLRSSSDYPARQFFLGLGIPLVILFAQAVTFLFLFKVPSKDGWVGCNLHRLSQFMQKKSSFFYPRSYALLASSLLLILGTLPAYGCFSSVFQMQMRLFTQFQLLETFKSVETSRKSFVPFSHWKGQTHAIGLDLSADCSENFQASSPYRVSNMSYGINPDFFFDTFWKRCKKLPTHTSNKAGLFEWGFTIVSHPFVPLLKGSSLWGFIGGAWPPESLGHSGKNLSRPGMAWNIQADQVVLYIQSWKTAPQSGDSQFSPALQLGTTIPLRPWFLKNALPTREKKTVDRLFLYIILGSVFLVWLIRIPKFIADRTVFLSFGVHPPFSLDTLGKSLASQGLSQNLILGFPGQGKTTCARQIKKDSPHNTIYFDLKAHPPETWQTHVKDQIKALRLQNGQTGRILIDHLDTEWKNPSHNFKKLAFLEWLFTHTQETPEEQKTVSSTDTEKQRKITIGDLVVEIKQDTGLGKIITKILALDKEKE